MRHYYVYILSSRNGALYIGITNDITRRVREHKQKLLPGFTAKYNINRLVWYQSFPDPTQAIATEKKLKSWRREKKIALIEQSNPQWRDLAGDFYPIAPPQPEFPRSARDDGRLGDINLSLE